MPTVRRSDVPPDVWAKLTAAADHACLPPGIVATPRKRKRTSASARTSSATRWSIRLELACRVVSEANRRDHWTIQRRRAELQANALHAAIAGAGLTDHTPPLPVVVTFTRTGRQQLDDDNLARAFKSLRDRLAEWIGVDDADPLVSWRSDQHTGEPGVTVTVASRHRLE